MSSNSTQIPTKDSNFLQVPTDKLNTYIGGSMPKEPLTSSSSPSPAPGGPPTAPTSLESGHLALKQVLLHPAVPLQAPPNFVEYTKFSLEEATPLDFLARPENAQRVMSRPMVRQFSQYQSFKPIPVDYVLPIEAREFTKLALDICKANGDVHRFALDTEAEYAVWLRTSATGFVRKLYLDTTTLPKFAPGNLTAYSRVLEGVSYGEFPFELLSVKELYHTFFLNTVFPYYVYLYAKDIRGERLEFSPEEKAFLAEFDYYSFVAFITYMGSLLLLAAEGYSRVLYEGVRWMLIRAYCTLGILNWDTAKAADAASLPDYSKVLNGALSPASMRFSLEETVGDSYAQYGWYIFKSRPNALYFLASITQIAFFSAYRFRPKDSTESLINTQRSYLTLGFVPYKPDYLSRGISSIRYRKKELNSFCNNERLSGQVFYASPISTEFLDISHEWYFLYDLLHLFDGCNHSPFYSSQKTEYNIAINSSIPCNPLSLKFPNLPHFGIRFNANKTAIRLDLAAYFLARYSMSFNPFILDVIPRKLYREISIEDLNSPTSIFSLSMEYNTLSASIKTSIGLNTEEVILNDVQRDALEAQSSLLYTFEQALLELYARTMRSELRLGKYCSISTDFSIYTEDSIRRNPLKLWEISISIAAFKTHADFIRTTPTIAVFELTKQDRKIRDEDVNIPADTLTSKVLLPRPSGKHLDAFFFAISMPPHSYQTMIVTCIGKELYAGFSGPISSALLSVKEENSLLFEKSKNYKIYPYLFLPMSIICSSKVIYSILDTMIDANVVIDIRNLLEDEYARSDLFSVLCDTGITPASFRKYLGSVNASEYLEMCSKLPMNIQVMGNIAAAYSILVPERLVRMMPADYMDLIKQHHDPADKFRKGAPGRIFNYVPRFTDINDQYIRKLFSPDMTKSDKKCLLDNCKGHTWKSIEARARVIVKKMLEEERVFNINILPVRNYTAKTKELLERNFNSALNVDPRLKVDDTKKTEAALRKKYLTPRPRRPL
jgi:hypothetical protein